MNLTLTAAGTQQNRIISLLIPRGGGGEVKQSSLIKLDPVTGTLWGRRSITVMPCEAEGCCSLAYLLEGC